MASSEGLRPSLQILGAGSRAVPWADGLAGVISGHQVVGQGVDTPENIIQFNKLQDLIDFLDYDSE